MQLIYRIFIYFILVKTALISFVWSSNSTDLEDRIDYYDPDLPYCFRFTWLGPEYTNLSKVNTTCDDYLDNTRAKGVPCRQPLVYTDDGSPPDLDYMWNNHRRSVICRQSHGHVCVKYSYTFDNALQNVTYMCTKVKTVGEGSEKNGCFKQSVNEYEVELCVCQSQPGPHIKPCNSAVNNFISAKLAIMVMFLTIINFYLQFHR